MSATQTNEQLLQENTHLQAQLAEAEETLRAIRTGEVDALVVSTSQGYQIFTLQSADQPYRLLIEQMQQGAVTISDDGIILYCNQHFAAILGYSSDSLVSHPIDQHILSDEREPFQAFLRATLTEGSTPHEFNFHNQINQVVPVFITANRLQLSQAQVICLIVTDLRERKRTEATLAQLAAIVTSSNDAIVSETLDGIITSWNSGAAKIFGYSADEIIHQPVTILVPPEMEDDEKLFLQQVTIGNMLQNYDTLRLRKDGSEVVVSVSASPIFDENGTITGVSKIIHDITRRKQTERELEKSQQQLRLITDSLPVLVSYVDQTMHYRFVNQYYENWFGLELDQIIGKHIKEIIGQAVFETIKPDIEAALNGKTVQYEREIPYPNGTRFTRTQLLPHCLADGRVVGMIAMVEDITERRRIDEALRQSEARYRSVITATSEGIILQGSDGTIQSCNTAAEHILGLTADQMMGLTSVDPLWRAVHEDGLPFPGETHPAMVTLQTGKPVSNVVMGVYKPDSSLTWILINSQPIFGSDEDSASAVVASFTDITERKEMEQQVTALRLERQRTKVLADFVRDTSHDLKTPLTVITTGLYLIQRIQDDAQRIEKIQAVERQVWYLAKVLNQLQQMAVLDSMTELPLQTGDLNSLILEVVSDVIVLADEKQITLSTALAEGMGAVDCDYYRLHRALVELIENAIRFTPPGGQIQVRSRIPNQHQLVLEVEDNGMGIPHDQLPHIFERFYKVDEARGVTGGAGLGLPMVKRVIELHHGSLEVESVPGERTIFRMIFPAVVLGVKTSDAALPNYPSRDI